MRRTAAAMREFVSRDKGGTVLQRLAHTHDDNTRGFAVGSTKSRFRSSLLNARACACVAEGFSRPPGSANAARRQDKGLGPLAITAHGRACGLAAISTTIRISRETLGLTLWKTDGIENGWNPQKNHGKKTNDPKVRR